MCVRVRFAVSYNGVKQCKDRDMLEENGAYATVALKRLSRVGVLRDVLQTFVYGTHCSVCACVCVCVCA